MSPLCFQPCLFLPSAFLNFSREVGTPIIPLALPNDFTYHFVDYLFGVFSLVFSDNTSVFACGQNVPVVESPACKMHDASAKSSGRSAHQGDRHGRHRGRQPAARYLRFNLPSWPTCTHGPGKRPVRREASGLRSVLRHVSVVGWRHPIDLSEALDQEARASAPLVGALAVFRGPRLAAPPVTCRVSTARRRASTQAFRFQTQSTCRPDTHESRDDSSQSTEGS